MHDAGFVSLVTMQLLCSWLGEGAGVGITVTKYLSNQQHRNFGISGGIESRSVCVYLEESGKFSMGIVQKPTIEPVAYIKSITCRSSLRRGS